ncbi:metal-dependent transcriptional regulator [Parapedobacter indicus]|uniref:Transcriptional regulator MntR n=1 Tax=Parapedobacter indicus TaxID=1477437 RepID=A0A1I3DB38_9SPHI|nr:metal-dependent transcriptional regulator [Parapedobacter indicus]PPL04599.1 DtxR family iron (metal) dependent repressor [Parapedobacter indicus]SFH83923.1 iron (metal) dependent repressor, DtxR family [Parapedobacter indicus]
MLSDTEENYLKALLRITGEYGSGGEAGTNQLAGKLNVRPATATDMLKKLREKRLVNYEKYGKISLTDTGRDLAIAIIRKHRLWETFLFDKLGFSWDEVHDIAEQLEHIKSDELVERLDKFLGFPPFDPHGDAIPTANGDYIDEARLTLAEAVEHQRYVIIAVKDNSPSFLQYVSEIGLGIHSQIQVLQKYAFDHSLALDIGGKTINISDKVAQNIYCRLK